MALPATGSGLTKSSRYWGPLALVALLAVTAGGVLPRLLPEDGPAADAPAKQVAATASDLHYAPPQIPEVPSTRALFLRLAGMTVLVLAVGIAVVVAGRHWLRGFTPTASGAGQLRLLETLNLGNRCSLHLVQLPSRQVVIGADATGIKSMIALPDDFETSLRLHDPEQPRAEDAA